MGSGFSSTAGSASFRSMSFRGFGDRRSAIGDRRSAVEAILHVQRPGPTHLHWPELDVDLSLDTIEHPERYPLRSRL
jgi:hypothetical protein